MNPYVGPRRFEEQDARFFYGREQESRDLLAFVISEPLALFYAQSGAGKSSLINASLIPGLRNDDFHVLPVGRVGGDLPEGISEVRNVYAFNLLSNLEPDTNPSKFSQMMLTDYLSQTKNANGNQQSRVLIIDQFEEVVTHHPGRWMDREDFFWQLQAAIHNDSNLWVVLSMREDHFASIETYAEILPGGLRARFRMERLKRSAAEMAIRKPAAAAGKPFEEGVARNLAKNLSLIREVENFNGSQRYGEYVEPVQLQVVCYQLWDNLKDRPMTRITHTYVEALGNVDRALGAFYDTAVQDVVMQNNISEIMLRNWFEKKLITEAHTRGTVYQGKEETEGLANDAVHQLTNKYLLRSERRAGAVWYELVHDRFIDPILQANDIWQTEQPAIVREALAWQESGRDKKWLMTPKQVKEELRSLEWSNLDFNVRAYVVACGRIHFQEQRREEILQKKLDRAIFDIQQKNKEIKRQSFWRGIMLLIAIITTVFALFSLQEANNAQSKAEAARGMADAAASTAVSERGTAEANVTTIAEDYETSINAEATMRSAQTTRDAEYEQTIEAQNNFMTAVAEGRTIADAEATVSAQSTSIAATATMRSIVQATNSALQAPVSSIVFVRYPPNFDTDQGVIYSINTDGSNERLLTSSNYSSRDPDWSPDGSEIIFASNIDGDYEIYVMNANGEDPSQWRKLTDNSWDDRGPVWSPNGQWIAYHVDHTNSEDQIYVMRMSTGDILDMKQNGNFPAWSPDSQKIAFGLFSNQDTRRIATINLNRGGFSGALTNGNDYWPSWSTNGRIAFTRLINNQMANTYICPSSSCENAFALIQNSNNGAPDWSPDGSQMVFYNDGGDGVNIWTMNSDGTRRRQITFSGLYFDTQPKWSP